jgi:hypothetical protein
MQLHGELSAAELARASRECAHTLLSRLDARKPEELTPAEARSCLALALLAALSPASAPAPALLKALQSRCLQTPLSIPAPATKQVPLAASAAPARPSAQPVVPPGAMAALRRELLAESTHPRDGAVKRPAAPVSEHAERAQLETEVSGLLKELREGSLALHQSLISGNKALDDTGAKVEQTLDSLTNANTALVKEHQRTMGNLCKMCSLLLTGAFAFFCAYAAIRLLPKPR